MATSISIKFFGVRAIHSTPGTHVQTTGGNTSCIELYDGRNRILINAGFGINIIGDQLFAHFIKTKSPVNCTMLFSDFLWDSILGLPFFTPIHFKSTEIDILTGAPPAAVQAAIDDVASKYFSPFQGFKGFRSDLSVRQLQGPMHLGKWCIRSLSLGHELTDYPVTAWRITHETGADIGVVLLCDPTPSKLQQVSQFLRGCQTLICGATTSPGQDGWGQYRMGFTESLDLAIASGAHELLLTQYHPAMTDGLLQKELITLKTLAQSKMTPGQMIQIRLASEVSATKPSLQLHLKKVG